MASDVRRRSSGNDNTGAKQSFVDHLYGSRLPRATILHFACFGSPFSSYLRVEKAIVGRVCPTTWRIFWYCASVMEVQAGKFWRPSNSSSYAADHVCLSWPSKDIIWIRV